jgi:hypothetical protein
MLERIGWAPDFLSHLMALANLMHLSLRKGAYVALSSAVLQEIRVPLRAALLTHTKWAWRRRAKCVICEVGLICAERCWIGFP